MTIETHAPVLDLDAFNPVGHGVVAMPDDERAAAAVRVLRDTGFEAEDILEYMVHGARMAEKYHRLVVEAPI